MSDIEHNLTQLLIACRTKTTEGRAALDCDHDFLDAHASARDFADRKMNDIYERIAKAYQAQEASLQELFDLLEKHEPGWYLRGHYKRAREALGGFDDN